MKPNTKTMEKSDTILEVRNATVEFDMERGTSRVLDHVSIDVRRNEFLAVVGESGSGKSMFASAMLDAVVEEGHLSGDIMYSPTNGEPFDVLELSKNQLRSFRWEKVAMVFQGAMSSFNPTMSIRDHFLETLSAHSVPRSEGMERAKKLLFDVYLEPDRILDLYPYELSGGMKQRTLLALSLLLDPEVLVMDEPTAALDLLMQQSIINMLKELKEKYGLTLIFITHDLPLVTQCADRVAVMYSFDFIEIGETHEILTNAAHPYTRALLASTPNVDAELSSMRPIEGSAPDAVNVPQGCSYHPRCPMADEKCRDEKPEFQHVEAGHESACYYWADVKDEIQLPYKTEVFEQ